MAARTGQPPRRRVGRFGAPVRPGRGPPLRLYGLVAARNTEDLPLPAGLRLETIREIAAVVGEIPGGRRTPAPPDLAQYREVVGGIFARCAVVPAPPGVVFRAATAVQRWLELHYSTLHDALAHVEGRAEARVHVRQAAAQTDHGGAADSSGAHASALLDGVATEIFQHLGRDVRAWVLSGRAVSPSPLAAPSSAGVPVAGGRPGRATHATDRSSGRGSDRDHPDANASFLVDRSRWRAFADAVANESQHHPALDVEMTGPWPPYDFVRLQFGG